MANDSDSWITRRNFLAKKMFFDEFYKKVNGHRVSREARRSASVDEKQNLLYGETPFLTTALLVSKIDPVRSGVFYDLGSGTGMVSTAAHLVFDFKKICGVELLPILHQKSEECFEEVCRQSWYGSEGLNKSSVKFLNADFMNVDLSDADLIYMNHFHKSSTMRDELEKKFLKELKPKTKIITIISRFKSPLFKRLGSKTEVFGWGSSDANFYEI